ncbi:MAG: type 4a pilus biogenesis protein PilO [Deltaproteobacteria bacterium]|nr:type 4a pilus biogenesis protein PilO [Deltaproteobacteria bacterium]
MQKIDINVILKLPTPKKLIILGAIWLVVVVVFYFLLYGAKMSEKSELTVKLAGLKKTVAEKQQMANNVPRLKKEREELTAQLSMALAQLPNEKEIANLLQNISDAAKSSRLEILTFKPGKEAPKGFYAEVTIDMKVEGRYANLVAFYERVAGLPRIVNISRLTVTSGKEVRGEIMMSANFIATTFKFLPQAAEAKK